MRNTIATCLFYSMVCNSLNKEKEKFKKIREVKMIKIMETKSYI